MANIFALESSFIPTPARDIPQECESSCLTSYGTVLGIFEGVLSYSNCNDQCINFNDTGVMFPKKETGFIRDVYVGVRWQCVEYARRYLITTRKVTFESIDAAFQIFNLTCLTDLTTENSYASFVSIKNGAQYPPKIGDLLIFSKTSEAPFGHVAVVTGLDLEKGYVAIAEQNINTKWENPDAYSRRIAIFKINGKYFVQESAWNKKLCLNTFSQDKVYEVIGWKRVGKFKNKKSSNTWCSF